MATVSTWTWKIRDLYVVNTPSPKYVVNVLWTLTGTDETNTGWLNGNVSFSKEPNNSFVLYENLTESAVIEWVKSSLGEAEIQNYKNNIQRQIDDLSSPITFPQRLDLPWAV